METSRAADSMEVHDHLVPFHLGGRGLVPACGCLGSGGTSLDPALPVLHRAGNAAGRLNPLPDVQRCFFYMFSPLFLLHMESFLIVHHQVPSLIPWPLRGATKGKGNSPSEQRLLIK